MATPSQTSLSSATAFQFTPRGLQDWLGLGYQAIPEAIEDQPLTRFHFDTRLIYEGQQTVFVALPGASRDGHDFLPRAYERGVRTFLVRRDAQLPALPGAAVLRVADPLRALQQIAAYHRQRFTLPVVGITGSNGKTIVKEWLASLLEADYQVLKSPRSYNSQLGVALAVLELRPWHEVAIFEAGISQRGEMQHLAAMIRPTMGILTHMGDAHAEGFASFDEKLREKLKLFATCQQIVVAEQLPQLDQLLQPARLYRIGSSEGSYWRVQATEANEQPGSQASIRLQPQDEASSPPLRLPFNDPASQANALLAAASARHLGVSWARLQAQLPRLHAVNMRMELITDNPEITLLNDSYNADAASVRHAFSLLAAQESQPRKVVIISDLEHQGERAPTLQRELAELALERFGAGNVMLIGPLFSRLMAETPLPGAAAYPDLDAFLKAFRYEDFTQSVILLKGARKFRLETLIPYFSQQAATTYLKINLNALKQNLEVFRSRVPNQTRLMAMLKAAAYGSGGWQLAQELEREGVDYIGVAYTVEGIELRRRGIRAPILVLNPDFATLAQLWRFELQPAVWSFPLLQQLAAIAAERQTALPIHLEFDTGMGRLGFEPGQVEPVLDALRSTAGAEHLPIASVFSHLAAADAPAQDPFTEQQLAQFEAVAERIQTQYPESLRHILNTGGALRWPGRAGDMVRIGLGLYGISPVPALQRELQEIASLHSSISQIHHYPAGTSISYGRTYVLEAPARIATIPVGYADGIPRALSNGKLEALVHGQRCPVVGVICMDMLMLDVTAVPQAQAGDEVVFFGRQAAPSDSETFQSITTLAEAANTIPYEILTGLSLRLRRLYVKE